MAPAPCVIDTLPQFLSIFSWFSCNNVPICLCGDACPSYHITTWSLLDNPVDDYNKLATYYTEPASLVFNSKLNRSSRSTCILICSWYKYVFLLKARQRSSFRGSTENTRSAHRQSTHLKSPKIRKLCNTIALYNSHIWVGLHQP